MVKKFTKRRGLSQIITSLILIAIVATVGSVVLFRGLDQISSFSVQINNLDKTNYIVNIKIQFTVNNQLNTLAFSVTNNI